MDILAWGTELKNRRSALDLTQTEFGKMLGLSQVTIANYERGTRFPKKETLLDIARIFDVSLDVLLKAPEYAGASTSFSRDFSFGVDALISLLLKETLDAAISYTGSWKQEQNLDLAALYETVLIPALIRTGSLWLEGSILVSEEHLISDKIRELVFYHSNRERERCPVKAPVAGRWMGLCAPGEKHELALLMLSHIVRLSGWQTTYLGTQVPFHDLSEIIKKQEPDVVAISITMDENLAGLEMYLRQLETTFGSRPAIMLGGAGALKIDRQKFPRIHTGAQTLGDAATQLGRLLLSGSELPCLP
ncbi:MAG: helix-turn-helix domain-containing protein [Spirochaetota bacterium]